MITTTLLLVMAAIAPRVSLAPVPEPVAAARPAAAAAAVPLVTADAGDSTRRRVHTVVVDAGHGGPDRGMNGPTVDGRRFHEKEITLSVSRRLAAELRKRGVNVVMTRTTDTLIALSDRGRIANRSKGDIFMSIHVNAANPNWKNASAARGFETYFLADAKTEDARRVAEMENASERYETSVESTSGDPLSFIYTDMRQNEFLRESSDLAAIVQRHLARIHPGPNRGVKQAGFRVLVTSFMPSVLVELGFGSNPAEARYLASPAEQQRIAEMLADAAEAYLGRLDRKIGGTP
ncbi:MAG TPA: N-acetylmuramoyl-L-alanine amidase [Gemmatimonadales bacterium]